jgi:glycosyltransferase involved in cell wall biosynthesis
VNNKRLSVSLVIPAYNEERHLAACLDYVAAQTVLPDQVIVVDNNSSDKTAAVAGKYKFVTLLYESKRGVVYARNLGFNASNCDIIARIDVDTLLPPDWVAHIEQFFAQAGNDKSAWTGGPYFYNVRFPRVVSGFYSLLSFYSNRLFAGCYSLWGSNMAIRNSDWKKSSAKTSRRNDIHEDLDLAIVLHNNGVKIVYDSKMKVRTQLRRVRTNRHELWAYLQWWPRTLRLHHKKSWLVCWFFGAFLLYYLTPLLIVAERLAQLFGKQPLAD